MGSLCLSSAPILRCESFTRIQNIVFIIPVGLEIIFSTSLIFTNWGRGRKHLLLTAEGWTNLALAILDLLTHIIPAERIDLGTFRTIDIVIASLSFIPILLYMLFLFFFANSELIDILPIRFRNVGKFMLLIFIPAIVASNEVASFIGISHRVGQSSNGAPALVIGFSSDRDKTLWTFFTSLTLALLVAYQAVNFSFSFFRLVKAFLHQRSIEASDTDERHFFKGIGWIAGGYKLGAIETVVGFAQGGFGGAFTRRILRFLSRAFLVIGLTKGLDTVVDFREIKDELSGNKKRARWSRRVSRRLISNPRLSTFQQLSPAAQAFHNVPAPPQLPGAVPTTEPRRPRQPGGLMGMTEFDQLRRDVIFSRGERVAVEFDASSGRPPTLHMRFSALNIPSPAVVAAELSTLTTKSRPQTMTERVGGRPSSYYANSTMTRLTALDPRFNPNPGPERGREREPEPEKINNVFAAMSVSGHGHTRDASQLSGYADSVNSLSTSVVNRLAAQFPGLPPRVTNLSQYRQTMYERERELEKEKEAELARNVSSKSAKSWKSSSGLSTSNSMKRKPAPRASAYLDEIEGGGGVYINTVPQTRQPVPLDPFEDTKDSSPLPTPGPIDFSPSESPERPRFSSPVLPAPHRRNLTAESGSTVATDYNFTRPWIDRGVAGPSTETATPGSYNPSSAFTTPNSENPFKFDERQQVRNSQQGVPFIMRPTNRRSRGASRTLSTAGALSELAAVQEDQVGGSYSGGDENNNNNNDNSSNSRYRNRGKSMETIDISWLRRPEENDGQPSSAISAYEEPMVQRVVKGKMSASSSVLTPPSRPRLPAASQSDPSLVRIKSIGKAPRRYTPAPVKTNYTTRGSIYIEPIVIPPRGQAFSEVELVQGSGISSVRSGPLRDSDVLGHDDKAYAYAQ
ncbi:hypothetical protein K435DRAFT_415048 [Dendrothele bispora CBS 962.96]|uniref:Uncharacterized protein n=1 Tax=Dendrothele bispora (strain CBS 962.96) TaxID=1314807 RepID=A0A4S8MVW1_DENBC|nr:hypothetical protein K435DRAFT_415048 [Dendrothele bispora CBS 962.96]